MECVNPPQCFCIICCVDIRRYSRFCHRCEVSLRESLACETKHFQTHFIAQLLSYRNLEERRAFIDGFYQVVQHRSIVSMRLPWHIACAEIGGGEKD